MNLYLRTWLSLSLVALIAGCDSGNETFTLYRNSVTDENMRIHVARLTQQMVRLITGATVSKRNNYSKLSPE